jgi:hypothetical protein
VLGLYNFPKYHGREGTFDIGDVAFKTGEPFLPLFENPSKVFEFSCYSLDTVLMGGRDGPTLIEDVSKTIMFKPIVFKSNKSTF